MAIKAKIGTQLSRILTSPRLRDFRRRVFESRRLKRGQPHRVTVFLRLNDPYSFVLLQVLSSLAQRFPIEYEFRTILALQDEHYPAPERWEKNAFLDGGYLASLYDLEFPQQAPLSSPERDEALTAQLLHWELQADYLNNALKLFKAYWLEDQQAVDALVNPKVLRAAECYRQHRECNESLLKQNGHYLSAMLLYGKEWYWGLDRLVHLEQRLNTLGLKQSDSDAVMYNRAYINFCGAPARSAEVNPQAQTPLEIYWSARSPYSYLGLIRARQLAEHYQVPLVIKAVLPMVMRRMQVPKTKRFYIIQDVKREAEKFNIDFGNIADPLGKGVERCYSLLAFAETENKTLDFLESFARGVWAEGISSDTDEGLKLLVERAGLNWQEARQHLKDESWRIRAQDYLAEMYDHGLWGVPSFKYGELCLFGQDRLDWIEREIQHKQG